MNPFSLPSPDAVRAATKSQQLVRTPASFAPLPDPAVLPLGADGRCVVLPYPSPALSPNARGHWSKRSRAAKAYRRECWVLALAAFGAGKVRVAAEGPIRLHIDFFPPDARARDDDNAIASFKAGRDGIADALKADDSRFVTSHLFHRACDPAQRGWVVVTLLSFAAPSGALILGAVPFGAPAGARSRSGRKAAGEDQAGGCS